jgi:hypothetical protein
MSFWKKRQQPTSRYRVCLVDENLDQYSTWKFIPTDCIVIWTTEELRSDKKTKITRYMLHETGIDAVGLCYVDTPAPLSVYPGDTVTLEVRFDRKEYKG